MVCTSVSDPSPTGSSEKHKRHINCQSNIIITHICVCIKEDMVIYLHRKNPGFDLRSTFCLYDFSVGALAGQKQSSSKSILPVIQTHGVVTVYIKDFLHHAMHFLLQVCWCTMPRRQQAEAFHWERKKKSKPLKPRWCVYNGAVRSYLAATTSIGSISTLSVGNQTGALTHYSGVQSKVAAACVTLGWWSWNNLLLQLKYKWRVCLQK